MRDAFHRLEFNTKSEGRRKPKVDAPFSHESCKALWNLPGSSDLCRSRKGQYRELVVGSTLDPFVEQLSWSLLDVRSQWNLVPGSDFLNNSEYSLTWRLAWNALPLADWAFKAYLET